MKRNSLLFNIFDVPLREFRNLKKLYPTGKYHHNQKDTLWFKLRIENLEIIWFLEDKAAKKEIVKEGI